MSMTPAQEKRIQKYIGLLQPAPALQKAAEACLAKPEALSGNDFEKSLYQTVFAPPLVCFVEWVLQEAQAKGIKRLYFLARDGYQMYLVAEILCKANGINMECRYLYGSRYAWRLPQFALEQEKCLDKICLGGIDVTFEKIMQRGYLTQEEAMQVAEELSFAGRYQEVLSYQEILGLKPLLKNSRMFLKFVYQHSREAYEPTVGYLKQEGLFEDSSYALVDSGWVGSLQQTLVQLLEAAGCKKRIEGFYFGLYDLPRGVSLEDYHTFYFGPGGGIRRKVYFSNCLYEAVHSAPHGMTVGYEKKEQEFVPVFFRRENLNQVRLHHMCAWAEEFCEAYCRQKKELGLQKQVEQKEKVSLIYGLWKRFMGNPGREEANSFGNLKFSDDVTETFTQNVAASLTKEELKNHTMLRKILIKAGFLKRELKESAWMEGSVVLAGSAKKWNLWNVWLYKYSIYIRKCLSALSINNKKGDRE